MAMNPTNGMAAGQPGTGNPFAGRSGQVPAAQDVQGRQAPREEQAAQPIGPKQLSEATQVLLKYKSGKAALDRRIVENEHWYRLHRDTEDGNFADSGWMFNSLANKHADAMDNYPEPNVLPRSADDEDTARALSSVLPVVLEQADYEQVYSDCWWRKLKTGTGVTGIFWDPAMRGGIGDIAVRSVNLLMLYWEPGAADIQASPDFFSLSLEDTAQLSARYPQLRGRTASVLDVPRYIHDEGQDTSTKSVVVDWYYKRPDANGRMVLHYCKFCNGVVLYASQNDPALAESGLYDHGQYPFVFDPLFVEEDSPAGFGYIDVMKDCQTAIDKMNHAMDENVLLSAKQRYVLSDTAGVNEEELADFSRDIVHVVGRLNDDSFRPLQTAGLQGNSLSYRQSRIEELKEISGNRDMTQGGTAGGVTAASAIAALQEAGSKLSRDMLKSAYRAFAKQCYLIIELMRQFYDEQRVFRIVGESGENRFVPFSAQALRAVPGGSVGGVELGSRGSLPVFLRERAAHAAGQAIGIALAAALHLDHRRHPHHLVLQLCQLLGKGAVLPHPLAHLLDAFKIHHVQCRKGGIGIFRLEKAQLIALLGRLVLRQAGEGGLFLRTHHDVKHRLMTAQLHAAHDSCRLGAEHLARKADELALAPTTRAPTPSRAPGSSTPGSTSRASRSRGLTTGSSSPTA